MHRFVPSAFGWLADLPDFRDLTPQSPQAAERLRSLKPQRGGRSKARPGKVDLRKYFSEPADQGLLNSSAAHACCALFEYFERRTYGTVTSLSRLFSYYSARRMAMVSGNVAVNLRSILKAAQHCGIPGEQYWPYDPTNLDVPPDAFLYCFCEKYRDLQYVRLTSRNTRGGATLDMVRAFLAAGFPSILGLSVPSSITRDPEIPYRPTFDSVIGGQCLVAVGYDDEWLSSTRGALLVRNSWGTDWGDNGYGMLPYAFLEEQLATDFWTVLRPDWLESLEFTRPVVVS